jgi:hypothetical protein
LMHAWRDSLATLFPFLQTLCCLRLLEGTRLQKVMFVHFVEPRSGSCMQSDESEGDFFTCSLYSLLIKDLC